ncbi:hypothetical protein ONZ45_g15134 [Pleurotus djamor]|nr:hypothetical protein ONZ45_g15134 [Pleurotus djamor]
MTLFTQADIEAQAAIDEEISKYRTLIWELSTRRNAHNAISKLPNEILSRILIEYKVVADAELRTKPTGGTTASRGAKITREATRDYPDSLLSVVHVCSLWRQVALDTAAFWSTIPLDRSTWVAKTFQRSKQSPLTLVGPPGTLRPTNGPNNVLSTVMDAAPRFQDVDLTLRHVDVNHGSVVPQSLFSLSADQKRREAPLLRTLKIAYDRSDNEDGIYHSHYGYNPKTLQFPWTQLTSLQSLNLRNIIPVAVPSMPSLTHLIIDMDVHVDSQFLTVPQVIDVLRHTLVVEKFTVACISTNDAHAITPPDPNTALIHLPQLRELQMTSIYLQESVIFAHLDTPALQQTKIVFDNGNDDPGIQPNGVISHIQRLVAGSIPSDVEALKVVVDIPVRITDETRYDDDTGYQLTVKGETDRDPPIFTLVIAALPLSAHCIGIFQSLPLTRITDLTLNRIEEDSEALAWSRTIPHLVQLKRFTVYKVPALSLLGAAPELSSHNGIDTNHNLTNVHNPELDTVNMDDVSLSPDDLNTLKSISRFRHERQNPLRRLMLDCFEGPGRKKYEEEMASYGTKVDWSEICDSESDDSIDQYDERFFPMHTQIWY